MAFSFCYAPLASLRLFIPPLYPATVVSLSYLSAEEQELVDEVLTTERYRSSSLEAEELRHEKKPLAYETIVSIVKDTGRTAGQTPSTFRLEPEFLARYFKPAQNHDEITAVIASALDYYFGKCYLGKSGDEIGG